MGDFAAHERVYGRYFSKDSAGTLHGRGGSSAKDVLVEIDVIALA